MNEDKRQETIEPDDNVHVHQCAIVHKYRNDGQTLGRIFEKSFLARDREKKFEIAEAAKYYVERAEIGHWSDEVFMSLYRAAQLMEVLNCPVDEVIAAYRRASEMVPT